MRKQIHLSDFVGRGLCILACLGIITSSIRASAAEGVQEYVDAFCRTNMDADRVVGAVVVIVEGGDVLLSKGYGLAHLERRIPVNAHRTRFRVGSVSKPITATAALQLVERGALDLDTDVNRYLDKVEVKGEPPVTLAHLLTHTAGFDVRYVDGPAWRSVRGLSLSEYLSENLPPRIMSPGRVSWYSDQGYSLVGHLVERAAGQSFDDHMRQALLEPLGMHDSTFDPARVGGNLATGYAYLDGRYQPIGGQQRAVAFANPAGSFVTTGDDMARFMSVHLRRGELGGKRVFGEATARAMQGSQHLIQPGYPWSFTHGFQREDRKGTVVLTHGGGVYGFASFLALVPSKNLGLFVSTNQDVFVGDTGAGDFQRDLFEAFMKEFVTTEKKAPMHSERPGQPSGQAVQGCYRFFRYGTTTIEKAAGLSMPEWCVEDLGEGKIAVQGVTYVERSGLVYEREDGSKTIAFALSPEGHVTHMFVNWVPFVRLRWHETRRVQAVLGGSSLVVLLGYLVFVGVQRLRRSPTTPAQRRARGAVLAMVGSGVLLLAGLAALMTPSAQADIESSGWPPSVVGLLALSNLFALCAGVTIAAAGWLWVKRAGSMVQRMAYSLAASSGVGLVWLLDYWNLVGWRLGW